MRNDTVLRNLDGEIARHRRGFDRVCVECFRPWPCPVRELDDYRTQYLELAGIEGTALRETERANRAQAEAGRQKARADALEEEVVTHLQGTLAVLAEDTRWTAEGLRTEAAEQYAKSVERWKSIATPADEKE